MDEDLVAPAAGEGGLGFDVVLHPFKLDGMAVNDVAFATANQSCPIGFDGLFAAEHFKINEDVATVIKDDGRGENAESFG